MLGWLPRWSQVTFEHVLALLLKNTCANLEILALEEGCNGDSLGLGRAGGDGLLLLLLLLHLLLLHLLLAHLLLLHVLTHGLGLELLDVLRDGHAVLLRLDGQLTLHGLDLLGSGLLTGLESCGHQVDLWLALLGLALLRRHLLLLLLLRRLLRWCRHFEGGKRCGVMK